MSRVVRGARNAVRRVARAVKNNWKPLVGIGLAAFTGGLAIGGISNFTGMLQSGAGFWTTVGSTMKAGVTGIAGTFGIGSGASGAFANFAGMQGATLMTGAGAQALGLATQAMGPAMNPAASAVGTYTGPGSGFMGGGGSLFGGGATANAGQVTPYAPTGTSPGVNAPSGAPQSPGGGLGLGGQMAVAAAPALVQGVGAGLMAHANRPRSPNSMWGVDLKTGEAAPWGGDAPSSAWTPPQMNQPMRGPDGKEYIQGPNGEWFEVEGGGMQQVRLPGLMDMGWA